VIRLALALTRADLRAAPGRAVTVAVLLGAAALLPHLLTVEPALGVVLAAGVAAAATAGAVAQGHRRHQVLDLNGGPRSLEAAVAALSVAGPGLIGALAATAVGRLRGTPPDLATALLLAALVPVAVAPVAAVAAQPLDRPRRSRRRTLLLILVVVVLTPTVIVPLAAGAALVGRQLARCGRAARLVGSLAAAGVAGGIALTLGTAESWFDLSILLFLGAVPLGLSVAWLGHGVLDLVEPVVRRLGPTARLAVVPLAERRHLLAPVAAAVALVTTLAAFEGVVGASFGAREADRRASSQGVGRAGTGPDQAIAVVSGGSALAVHRAAAGEAARTGLRVAVIDRLGPGGTQIGGDRIDLGAPPFLGQRYDISPTWRLTGVSAPSWVGVVEPADLAVLGLGHLAPALARGDVVVLPTGRARPATADLRGPDGSRTLPAVAAPGRERALSLPAALVSPARAAELGPDVRGGRVVVGPGPVPAGPEALVGAAGRIRDAVAATDAPAAADDDGTALLAAVIEAGEPVVTGDEVVYADRGGPLNEVPFLARTRDEARGQALALGALALLVSLAGALLALEGSRSDDATLEAQGAPARVRAVTAAVQAAVLTGTAATLAAVLGVGLPAVGFALYNSRPRAATTLDIPLVVPWELGAVLVALPVVAAALAALATVARRPPDPATLDDLAW